MRPVIFGLEGPRLSNWERGFLAEIQPAGIILFARNIESPDQVTSLTHSVRSLLGRDLLVLIDQEGGRVRRLRPPHWRDYPAMGIYARMTDGAEALSIHVQLMANDLVKLGINTDCIPLLDIPVVGADDIIGDRALGHDGDTVISLAQVVLSALDQRGVLPVIKHMPGHGRAAVDSHLALPEVATSCAELEATDFAPFKALAAAPLAMTAHITYNDIDSDQPATMSAKVIDQIIRQHIGYTGLLMTDDLSMQALSGDMAARARKSLQAGCDLLLHCNGDPDEMKAVASGMDGMTADISHRVEGLLEGLHKVPLNSSEETALEQRYADLTQHKLSAASEYFLR